MSEHPAAQGRDLVRVWQFERIDGSRVFAVGDEVVLDESGYTVRGEPLGWAPYQCFFEEVKDA